ncbi:TPA: D-2-hydroxyacid dehydrogenase family protein [Vibrio vulnificus]|uniref:D-2-hydroxyacid dehydrogenase family protein n=1 Tax=Vibrio vulnificus TaxID=672 RepID=UPI000D3E30FD|nr:D-2-hydroxyacid dehydrogenase family protein [Vibrio vulnificus]EHU9448332.1 D-2-hydroxyacid dehydrogenase family protein [Vibrio vulnificus]EHU9451610.1 D-2-hydroxyacid dehydrogenase family protein [Vibrio vulnificus]ELV8592119.1 D-2-hydroxyacid dehydrogenase family protein [Vibrio vulnificus]ELV8592643.1 D-2-hydroxyacid dehydrogenase family protein [Vibrio vulnificus]PUZ94919.1 3-phosphoglycerate dehydrogenase [Vibrio vulnificus]
MKIAILDDYQDQVRQLECFAALAPFEVTVFHHTETDEAILASALTEFDALVLIRERTAITASLLAKLPNLKLISQTGKISNHLDLHACNHANVAVAEGVGSPIAPSELCWALIMAASREIVSYAQQLQQGEWQQNQTHRLGRTLHGQTIGIWGYGKIGQRIAGYAKAFGLQVMVWGSESSRRQAQEDGFLAADSKEAFFQQCDIVSLHLRLNAATRAIVKTSDLATMKPGSLFVNISRAELVEAGALFQEMQRRSDKFAAIDVYHHEPATMAQEPILTLPNVLCTPHIGYVEQNSYELYFRYAFDNIVAFAHGQAQNIVNPEVLSRTE